MDLREYVAEKKGTNIVRGVVSSILTLALGAVMLGLFNEVGADMVAGSGTSANETYHKIMSKGFVILYMVIIVPIALVVGTILSLV